MTVQKPYHVAASWAPRILYALLYDTALGARLNPAYLTQPSTTPTNPSVTFILPLIAKSRSNDWAVVSANLQRSLESFYRQENGNWRAIICGQDRPDGLKEDDKVFFLHYPRTDLAYDKISKWRWAARALKGVGHRDGYVMPFDADDIAHPHLTSYILQNNNGHGYVISHGFMVDLAGQRAIRLHPPTADAPHATPFWHHCGSCTVLRVDLTRGWFGIAPLLSLKKHADHRNVAQRFGFELQELPFEAMCYVVNHGENMQLKRNRDKTAYFDDGVISLSEWEQMASEFGLS